LAEYFRSFRRVALAHPALAGLLATGRITIPAVFDHLEALIGALQRSGVSAEAAVRAFYAGLAYTVGFVIWEIPRSHLQRPDDYGGQWRSLLAGLDPERYPVLTGSASQHVGTVASGQQFEWGLQHLLGGLSEPSSG